ncbi:OmpA family protein [Chitinophaga agrisoli]|uniref:OmpA family protein n=1 Tax=Chitinophaga agrisoli TaxID=2607653 RepID=A0A5B2VXT9_9BACT|nr:OmpA family protein [Chitinophaga agrisoli]KAA2243132.1 OmpA family protein [Chitinophaga agrisoli]
MSFDLLNTVKGLFTGDVISQAAGQLGESESGIQKAITGIVPAVLTGLLYKAGSQGDPSGALQAAKDATGANSSGTLISSLQNNAGGWLSKGTSLLQNLFGSKVSTLITSIATFAGIKESSASTLLNAATPATLGTVGQYAEDENLNAGGFLSFLNSQKDNILGAVPSGFNLAGLLGLGSLSELGRKLGGITAGLGDAGARATESIRQTGRRASGSPRWIWSLLLILVAIILLWYLVKGCGGSTTETVATDTIAANNMADTAVAQVASPGTEVARESIKVSLPDGTVLNAYKGGIEDQLVAFLKDDSRPAGKDVWFDFDNLNFRTGSAEIMEESQGQVQNIAAILKAFPKARIKVGGYTDRSGDSLSNIRLSQSRADAVLAALKTLKTDNAQLQGAEGYGSQFAKAPATAPDDERKKDRHISVSVREK